MASLTVVKAAESNSAVSDPAFSIWCKGVTHKHVRWVATYQRNITGKITQTTIKLQPSASQSLGWDGPLPLLP